MKTILLVLVTGLATHFAVLAQSSAVIRMKGGVGQAQTLPFSDRYRYNQFRAGKVLFQDGTAAAAMFNYNVMLGEMQFINPQGDTLALTNEPIVRLVGISGPLQQDVFWYDQKIGYAEMIADYGTVKLTVTQGLKTVKNEKRTAYGQSSGASAITTYQYHAAGNAPIAKLDSKGDVLFIKDNAYYFIDQNNRFYPANKASLLKVFSKHREQITAYLTNNSINFNREEDLKKLLKYCNESI